MGGEGSVLGAGVGHGDGGALHVAGLTGGVVGGVEDEGILFGELRGLPFVVGGEGANPLVVVEHDGQVGLVADEAELGGLVEGLHDRFAVAVEVHEDVGVGDGAGDAVAVGVEEDGRDGEDVAAVAGAVVDALDRVADHAGDAVCVKATIGRGGGSEAAGEDGDGVVATIAVAREGYAFFVDEEVDAGAIEGAAEGVGVEGLTPLVVGLGVTVAAVFGSGEG